MNSFVKAVEVRWADLDPNFHLRHSVYYDYGASVRIDYLQQHGITPQYLVENNLGPILFREECQFKREIRSNDLVTIDLKLVRSTANASRWAIRHQIFKNDDTLSAILTVEGAWIDTVKRKLTQPPAEALKAFQAMPRIEEFEWS